MSDVVHFVLVSDRDMKLIRVAKDIGSFHVDNVWLGSLDGGKYFTSEPRVLYNPANKPWFVVKVSWWDPDKESRVENIATNGDEWTYVKQSLGWTRIPFTDALKAAVNKKIENFWRKA